MRVVRYLVMFLGVSACLAVALALLGFDLVARKISRNERAPTLTRVSEPMQDLTYRTLDGMPQHLSATKGKVIVLDLWGTWCVQCVAEMPTMQRLFDRYRNDPEVRFLIVSRMDSPAMVRAYARRNGFDLPFYVTRDEEIPSAMWLNQFPSTFVYGKDGRLAAQHVGAADWSDESVVRFMDALKRE